MSRSHLRSSPSPSPENLDLNANHNQSAGQEPASGRNSHYPDLAHESVSYSSSPSLEIQEDEESLNSQVTNTSEYRPQRLFSHEEDSDKRGLPQASKTKSNISIASTPILGRSFDESLAAKLKRTVSGISAASTTAAGGASGSLALKRTESFRTSYSDQYVPENDLVREKTRQTIISVLSKRANDQASYYASLERHQPGDDESKVGIEEQLGRPVPEKFDEDELKDEEEEEEGKKEREQGHEDKKFLTEDVNAQQLPTVADGSEFASMDPELVTWDTKDDPNYPRNWPKSKKLLALGIVATYTFVGQSTSSVCALAMNDIDKEMNVTNHYFSSAIVSIFLLSQGVSALITSPLSELYGRRVVLSASIFVLFCFNLGCALTHDPYSLFVFRFFTGVGAAAPFGIGPGILADMFDNLERNRYMSYYNIGPNCAPVFGPLIAGFIVQHLNWRWVFWILVILDGSSLIFGLVFLRETYSPVLLRWKCEKLRKATGNQSLKTIYDIANVNETPFSKIMVNIARPLGLLVGHPMVYGLGIFMAFLFGFFYLILISFPTAWGNKYGFQPQIQGLMYLSFGIAFLIWTPIWTSATTTIYRRLTEKNNGVGKPEYRITLLYLCGIFCPIGLFIYGWCIQYHTFWFFPCIGAFIYTGFYTGMFTFVTNYIVDMNPRFSASSNSALSLFRSIFGFVFPIFAPKMYNDIGYGWGNTIFFFIGMVLGIPFPLYVYKYGEGLRVKANLKFDRKQAERDARNLAKAKQKADKKVKLEKAQKKELVSD